jgi:hypothetical protein
VHPDAMGSPAGGSDGTAEPQYLTITWRELPLTLMVT